PGRARSRPPRHRRRRDRRRHGPVVHRSTAPLLPHAGAARVRTAALVLLLVAAVARADEPPPLVTVHAEATPAATPIGTRVRYTVTVNAPKGIEIVVAQPAERIGDMDIVDFGTEPPAATADGRVVFKRWWQLVAWSPGHHLLSSPEVRYRPPGGELAT